MNKKRAVAAAVAAVLLPYTASAQSAAQPASTQAGDSNADLRQEIEAQKQRLAVLERRYQALRVAGGVVQRALAAAAQVDRRLLVGDPLEVESDAHTVRCRAAPVVVEPHRATSPPSSMVGRPAPPTYLRGVVPVARIAQ